MAVSAEPLQGYDPGLTIGQAASRLKVSSSTIRRWVRSGRLRSTQVTVGDGFEYRIPLEALDGVNPSMSPSDEPFAEDSANGSAAATLEASVERSTAVAAYNAQLLAPLVAVIERQAEKLVSQAETIGQLRAELAAARVPQSPVDAPTAPEPPHPTTEPAPQPGPLPWPLPPHPNVRTLAPWLLLVVLAIGVVVVGLVWSW